VEASRRRPHRAAQAEVGAARTMIGRAEERFGSSSPAGWRRHRHGSAPNLEVNETGIALHVPVIDKSKRDDGTFSRKAFIYDKGQDINMCPERGAAEHWSMVVPPCSIERAIRAIARTSSSPMRIVTGRKSRYCFHT
jgi:hypothetical protein